MCLSFNFLVDCAQYKTSDDIKPPAEPITIRTNQSLQFYSLLMPLRFRIIMEKSKNEEKLASDFEETLILQWLGLFLYLTFVYKTVFFV